MANHTNLHTVCSWLVCLVVLVMVLESSSKAPRVTLRNQNSYRNHRKDSAKYELTPAFLLVYDAPSLTSPPFPCLSTLPPSTHSYSSLHLAAAGPRLVI